jgi:hypothetical protein
LFVKIYPRATYLWGYMKITLSIFFLLLVAGCGKSDTLGSAPKSDTDKGMAIISERQRQLEQSANQLGNEAKSPVEESATAKKK